MVLVVVGLLFAVLASVVVVMDSLVMVVVDLRFVVLASEARGRSAFSLVVLVARKNGDWEIYSESVSC